MHGLVVQTLGPCRGQQKSKEKITTSYIENDQNFEYQRWIYLQLTIKNSHQFFLNMNEMMFAHRNLWEKTLYCLYMYLWVKLFGLPNCEEFLNFYCLLP